MHQSLSKDIKRHPLLFLLILLSGWMLITVIFSTHQLISAKYFLAKVWYLGAFVLAPLIVLKSKKSITTAFIVLAGSMLLAMTIILFRQYSDGFSFARINSAVSPFFRNHVNYSAMLVCMLPVLVAFFSGYGKKEKLNYG
ncbi:MAG: hypothetical protein IPO53_08645 [Chitinophagaceae bacterium]|nr:hypothetical protein [Chitinophagaceae bacterium]